MERVHDSESDSGAPAASGGGQPAIGGDGELVGVGTRVQTQELVSEGGSGDWFAGTVLALHPSGDATVVYDDGEEWTGPLSRIYLLQGDDEESPLPPPGSVEMLPLGSASAARPPSQSPPTPVVGVRVS